MASYNRVILLGYLTRDPRVKERKKYGVLCSIAEVNDKNTHTQTDKRF